MKRLFIALLIWSSFFATSFLLPVAARERAVTVVSQTSIVSEGLYFKICDITAQKTIINVTVEAKNKSMLSQAVYVELTDEEGNTFKPENKDCVNFFGPLKFNKPVTQKMSFTVPSASKDYLLAVYSKDIFKKNKKQIITKMSLNEAKKELKSK